MIINIKHGLSLVCASLLLNGCATSNTNSGLSARDRIIHATQACIAAAQRVGVVVVQVPSSSDFIANKIATASVGISGSNAVDGIVSWLSGPQSDALMVMGDDDDLAAATLRAALKKVKSDSSRSPVPVCFVGSDKHAESLKAAASSSGVPVFVVQQN